MLVAAEGYMCAHARARACVRVCVCMRACGSIARWLEHWLDNHKILDLILKLGLYPWAPPIHILIYTNFRYSDRAVITCSNKHELFILYWTASDYWCVQAASYWEVLVAHVQVFMFSSYQCTSSYFPLYITCHSTKLSLEQEISMQLLQIKFTLHLSKKLQDYMY